MTQKNINDRKNTKNLLKPDKDKKRQNELSIVDVELKNKNVESLEKNRRLEMTKDKFVDKLKKKEATKNKFISQSLDINMGSRYLLYINIYNKCDVGKKYFSTRNFLDDVSAIRGYKQFVRNFLLKKYSTVTFTIEKPEFVNQVKRIKFIGRFREDRIGTSQRTVNFLHRER